MTDDRLTNDEVMAHLTAVIHELQHRANRAFAEEHNAARMLIYAQQAAWARQVAHGFASHVGIAEEELQDKYHI